MIMSKRKWIVAGVLLAYFILIILPPIIHGYVYPVNGDDTAVHLKYFGMLEHGEDIGYSYFGRQLIGYPMIAVHKIFGIPIDVQFLWFNYLALWFVGVAVFLLVTKVAGVIPALISIPVVMFATPSTLNLFDTGGIFDLITVGILLPFAVLGIIYILETRKWYWILLTAIAIGLAVVVHSMLIFQMNPAISQPATPLNEFVMILAGFPIAIILLSATYFVFSKTRFNYTQKYALMMLGGVSLIMGVLAFTQLTAWATRFATDLAIILAILAGVMLALVINQVKSRMVMSVIAVLIVLSSLPVLVGYYHYNSAVKTVDIQAMNYVKSLPGDYFSCSPTVNPYIYERFVGKIYKLGTMPYIERSKPMTSGSTKGTRDYWWGDGLWPSVSLDNAVKFEGGGVMIYVVP